MCGFGDLIKTEKNDFIVLEGDEYLSSPMDRRPKFHLYHPNIALISGIAWDHINVFPTYENYVEQFEIFIQKITNGGILVYNEEFKNFNLNNYILIKEISLNESCENFQISADVLNC